MNRHRTFYPVQEPHSTQNNNLYQSIMGWIMMINTGEMGRCFGHSDYMHITQGRFSPSFPYPDNLFNSFSYHTDSSSISTDRDT